MKTILAASLLAFGTANAQTINLNPAGGFGALHQYHEVTTDAVPDDPVTIYLSASAWLQFDSEVDTTGLGTGDNWHWTGAYVSGGSSVLQRFFCTGPLFDRGGYYSQDCSATGEQMTMTLSETSRVVRGGGSGRGGYARHTIWTLLGGTLVR